MRRSWKVAAGVLLVLVAAATAGVTSAPEGPESDTPVVVEDPVPQIAVRSSTRGQVTLDLAGDEGAGGQPYNPGGQAESSALLTERQPVPTESAPATGEASTESVLGRDGRIWLRDRTTQYPNSAIGRVDYRQGGRNYWCTGSLVDADTVLTAGHCVHDGYGTEEGWSTRIEFIPGAQGNTAPFGSCGAVELLTLPGWYTNGAEYQDVGLIQLDCTIGETTGWFGYRYARGATGLRNVPVHLRGYPGDKVWSSLWTMRDRVRVSQARMAFYAADTYGGQSGSPVFNFRQCNGVRGPCILAVHAYGVHPSRVHAVYNHGPRLDQRRVEMVEALAGSPAAP